MQSPRCKALEALKGKDADEMPDRVQTGKTRLLSNREVAGHKFCLTREI